MIGFGLILVRKVSWIKWAVGVAMAAALTGQTHKIIHEVRIAELKLLKETAAVNWGCPSIFGKKGCTDFDPKRYK